MSSERVVAAKPQLDDQKVEGSLRPRRLDEYIGQARIKNNIRVFIQAAKQRGEPLEHVLLYGPPGLGKTTLAYVLAHEMSANIHITSGPVLERAGDLAALLTNLQAGDVLFIDEIHRLPAIIEEVLYPAMEDYRIELVLGKGPSARAIQLDLPHFTLIGATTRLSLLSGPLRDRFGNLFHLNFYSDDEMEEIIRRSASILGIGIEPIAAQEIAVRARKTPRIANRLLKRIRDYAQVQGSGAVTVECARTSLDNLEVDQLGLDEVDRRILRTIIEKFNGGPVGLGTLAAATSEEEATVEEVYEPFLMQIGFLARTSRGRVVTPLAYAHLGLDSPETPSGFL